MTQGLSSRPDMVITRVPLRISFSGGGSDFPEFFLKESGAVFSMTINRYIYVTVKRHSPLFEERYRLNYFESEHVNELSQIRNHIIRECLRMVPIDPPVYVNVISDVPAASGLGSSSAFAVALLHALYTLRGEPVSPTQLVHDAARIEIDVLKRPIGIQDHTAAGFGGLNLLRFLEDGTIALVPHAANSTGARKLVEHMMLFWSGMTRDSAEVLSEQSQRTSLNLDRLRLIRDTAVQMSEMTANGFDVGRFAALLDASWMAKRGLASGIATQQIDDWYDQAKAAGALAGKLCGAGGGGFLLFLVPPDRAQAVRDALEIPHVPVALEPLGTQVIFSN